MKNDVEKIWAKILIVCKHAVKMSAHVNEDIMPLVTKKKLYNYEWRIRRYIRKQDTPPDIIKVIKAINKVFDTYFEKSPISILLTVSIVGYELMQIEGGKFQYKEVHESENNIP